jgi:hypothetical protein
MVPAALMGPCIFWWHDWMIGGEPWKDLAVIPAILLLVLIVAAAVNLGLYIYDRWTDLYTSVQLARNSTPEVRMFEAAKGMHPQAVEALLIHRRAIWRIKYVPLRDVADWILDEAPTVHAGFVDFVLDHSRNGSVMSKRLLSDKSKQFDPEGLITDYQQYDDLIFLMQRKLICTEAFGNQPPQWLAPWNADLVRHRFGLDGDQYVVEEQSEAIAALRKAQEHVKVNGNGAGSGAAQHVVPSVIEQALDGLEQTQEMRARTQELFKSKS